MWHPHCTIKHTGTHKTIQAHLHIQQQHKSHLLYNCSTHRLPTELQLSGPPVSWHSVTAFSRWSFRAAETGTVTTRLCTEAALVWTGGAPSKGVVLDPSRRDSRTRLSGAWSEQRTSAGRAVGQTHCERLLITLGYSQKGQELLPASTLAEHTMHRCKYVPLAAWRSEPSMSRSVMRPSSS